MEILLAILLLIGAVSVGPSTAGKGEDAALPIMDLPKRDDTSEQDLVMPIVHQRDAIRCHMYRDVNYRDLTVPYKDEIDRLFMDFGDCGEVYLDE